MRNSRTRLFISVVNENLKKRDCQHYGNKSNAKNDPCGAKLEQFYHTAYNDMEVILGSCLPRVTYFARMPVFDLTGRHESQLDK